MDEVCINIAGIDNEDKPLPADDNNVSEAVPDSNDDNDSNFDPDSYDDNDSNFNPDYNNDDDSENDNGDEYDEESQYNDDTSVNVPLFPEADDEIQGVKNEKITGVEDEQNAGVDEDVTTGVDDADNGANADDDECECLTAGRMRLRPQHRKEYNMFNINRQEETEPIVLLQFDHEGNLKEQDQLDAECMFLAQSLRWKEFNEQTIKCLEQYLLHNEQMFWKMELKVFQKKGEEAIQEELQQIRDVEGFESKHWHNLPK